MGALTCLSSSIELILFHFHIWMDESANKELSHCLLINFQMMKSAKENILNIGWMMRCSCCCSFKILSIHFGFFFGCDLFPLIDCVPPEIVSMCRPNRVIIEQTADRLSDMGHCHVYRAKAGFQPGQLATLSQLQRRERRILIT